MQTANITRQPYSTPAGCAPVPGALVTPDGTSFAVFAPDARAVDLCLFDEAGIERRIPMAGPIDGTFSVATSAAPPGTRYGFRAHGPWDPAHGLLFDPDKLLLDPASPAVDGPFDASHPSVFTFADGDPTTQRRPGLDSAHHVPRSVVVALSKLNRPTPLRTADPRGLPWESAVVYEAHVRAATLTHPDVPAQLRGTFAGMASDAMIDHLKRLGITTLELMPVQSFVSDARLDGLGLTNFWGYAPTGLFAPHAPYAAARTPLGVLQEFADMVSTLHTAGIEVILDVVLNHSGESGLGGPSLSFRGLANRQYYRALPDDPAVYMDWTGTGNTFNVAHPYVLSLLVSSLRFWVEHLGVDGFRFDLTSAIIRDGDLLATLDADPVLSRVRLIAEPWDAAGAFDLGRFPPRWSEWNGYFRDDLRDFWRGEPGSAGRFAERLAGSPSVYAPTHRPPSASLNFVTCHDGFTLHDLVSYNEKHNDLNGEHNRDGESHNRSWNSGTEGPTSDADTLRIRNNRATALLASLFVARGVPMLLSGDEIGRTQCGNNNAYCHDSQLSWLDWPAADDALTEFVSRLARMRREIPLFRQNTWLDADTVSWLNPSADAMLPAEWGSARTFGMRLNVVTQPDGVPHRDQGSDPLSAATLPSFDTGSPDPTLPGSPVLAPTVPADVLVWFNASGDSVECTMPDDARWSLYLDSSVSAARRQTHPALPSAFDAFSSPSHTSPLVTAVDMWSVQVWVSPTA